MGLFSRGKHTKISMGSIALASLTALATLATSLLAIQAPASAVTQTFSFTGGPQIYVVPDAVTSISLTLNGAQGGTPAGGGTGGAGARVNATLSVNPGEVLMIMVGGNGSVNGGWNGGGRGAGTGGGATDIRRQSGAFNTSSSCAYTLTCSTNDRVLVAGGGGGGGWAQGTAANANGGAAGENGSSGSASNIGSGDATAGQGATQVGGGTGGSGTFTSPGQGASAGSVAQGAASAWVASATGGGGGGGYFGGGSGGVSQDAASTPQADGAGGGGGGSSWAGGSGVSAATFNSGANTGDGSVTIDPPSAIPTAAFGFTGAPQYYTVPANTSSVFVRLYGGGAGTIGDVVYGRLPVSAGQQLQINVGGRGYGDVANYPGKTEGQGGWNGGGNGFLGAGWNGGSGGAGATDIRACSSTPCALADRIIVAGGGGGSSYGAWGLGGGRGGAGSAGDGGNGGGGDFGLGATLTAGGATSGAGVATAGALGQGGQSGQPFYGAGGGGGGLFGGGGGNGSGGGGGSSCASITGACNIGSNVLGSANAPFAHTQGLSGSSSDGMAVITAMPEATTGAVTNILSTSANISATINAKFLASTPKLFISTNQQTIESCSNINAPCTPSSTVLRTASLATVLAGNSTQSVAGSIAGLSANTTYFTRVCAQSVAGYSCGATTSFTTQLSIANSSLANGTVGVAYSDNLIGSGGSGTYTNWALVNATALPAGLSLNPTSGAITGTATAASSTTVDIEVTDSSAATATKTLAIVIATPSVAPSAPLSSAPQVTQISPRTVSSAGGATVTVQGFNFSNATATIGGVPVSITVTGPSTLSFVVPAGLPSQPTLVIVTPQGTLTFAGALTVVSASPAPKPTTSPISKIMLYEYFAPGSAVLTSGHLTKLKATAKAATGFNTIVCVGYTMGPTVLPSDTALAKARATNVCSALNRLRPNLRIIKSTGVTEIGIGGKVRRVEVSFRND